MQCMEMPQIPSQMEHLECQSDRNSILQYSDL